jgi:hypothetical protein
MEATRQLFEGESGGPTHVLTCQYINTKSVVPFKWKLERNE